MGTVTDVKWKCPGCGEVNIAQLYGHVYPAPLSHEAIPLNAKLKWNPPCEKCGEYKLVEPPLVLVEFPIVRVRATAGK